MLVLDRCGLPVSVSLDLDRARDSDPHGINDHKCAVIPCFIVIFELKCFFLNFLLQIKYSRSSPCMQVKMYGNTHLLLEKGLSHVCKFMLYYY